MSECYEDVGCGGDYEGKLYTKFTKTCNFDLISAIAFLPDLHFVFIKEKTLSENYCQAQTICMPLA